MNCLNCGVTIPTTEIAAGWCEACGKKIPIYAFKEAGIEIPLQEMPSKVSAKKQALQSFGDGMIQAEGQGVMLGIAFALAVGIKYLFKIDDITFYASLILLALLIALIWAIWSYLSNRRKKNKGDREKKGTE